MPMVLTLEQEAIVQARMASGRYESVEDVITEALYSLGQSDEDHLAWIRREVEIGVAELKNGVSAPLEPLHTLIAEARERYYTPG